MALHERQFSNHCLLGIHCMGWWLIFPCYWLLNIFLSLFKRTSDEIEAAEEDPCYQRLVILTFAIPVLFALFLVSAPFALLGLVMWIPVNHVRKPYIFSHRYLTSESLVSETMDNLSEFPALTISSANVLLLPEAIARFNNLSSTQKRARHIGRRIVSSQSNSTTCSQVSVDVDQDTTSGPSSESQTSETSQVFTEFPSGLDFLCLQEVFDQRAGHSLVEVLHRHFPYVIYDVGQYTWRNNYFILNSGLLFASRYPILDADFECFEHCANEDSLAAKGVLMVKVRIGSVMHDGKQKEAVGYIANTHLQAEHGEHDVRNCQLTDAYNWLEVFKSSTKDPRDVVLFDVFCGDFNFDNVSEMCETHWNHKLMTMYKDPCRKDIGVDHPWTVGTELIQRKMHSKWMKTPDMMKSILDDESRRHKYVESTKSNNQDTENGKRRIDFILYNNSCPVNVEEYYFVTSLATLTDHIPVAMTFRSAQVEGKA